MDKTFGWGFATETQAAWVNGGSPTKGFLTFGLALVGTGSTLGLGNAWANTPLVQRLSWLK